MSSRFATALIFFVNGAVIGTWLAQVPWVQGALDASRTELGLVLPFSGAGALIAMPLTGQLLTRISSRWLVRLLAPTYVVLLPLMLLAPSLPLLAAILFVFGLANGTVDVSMNAHGVAVERALRRPIMSSLHAGWSLGGLAGATAVALSTGAGVEPRVQATLAAVVLSLLAILAGRHMGVGSLRAEGTSRIMLPSRAILPLGAVGIMIALVEGGISDWGGIYLRRDLAADPAIAAASYAALSLGLSAGRLVGDALNQRLGAGRLVQLGMAVTAVSFGAALIVAQPWAALLGIAIAGVGMANGLPLIFSAAGHIPPQGPSLSAVFTMTYVAFLVGPAIIGTVSDAIGLPPTLALFVLLSLIVTVVARRTPGMEGVAPHSRVGMAAQP